MLLTLVQNEIVPGEKLVNIQNIEKTLLKQKNVGQLIILPELFTTFFSDKYISLAENQSGPTVQYLQSWAVQLNTTLIGSILFEENKVNYNRLLVVNPNGIVAYYDKRHLFGLTNEPEVFQKGIRQLCFNIGTFDIKPMICYDLRFPVWCRNTQHAHLMIFVANWPKSRIEIWKTLLKARAIENQCYVCGVNAVGTDTYGTEYNGQSLVVGPDGNPILELDDKPQINQIEISMEWLNGYRKKYPFLKDQDLFELRY